jgi:four helix bundle protein
MQNEKVEDQDLSILEEEGRPYNIRHRCFHFAKDILRFESEVRYRRIHFSIFDQLVRSATSIGANVVEGGAGSSKKDFIKFIHIALKSANETKYWLCLVRDTVEVEKDRIITLLREADELSKIIGSILVSAR